MTPACGQVYRCDVGFGLKPWLIVSNNARNRHTADVLAVRLTTTVRQLPTWVPLSSGDPLTGYANADNIETLAATSPAITWARCPPNHEARQSGTGDSPGPPQLMTAHMSPASTPGSDEYVT